MDYKKMQELSGLKVGDKVKVVRDAEHGEYGWPSTWNSSMRIPYERGAIREIEDIFPEGIVISNNSYLFPFFCLQLVEKAKIRKEAWVNFFMGGGKRLAIGGAGMHPTLFNSYGEAKEYTKGNPKYLNEPVRVVWYEDAD